MNMINVGANIRAIRKLRGLTLEQLAITIGSDGGNLSRIETGKQRVTDDMLMTIATALSVPPSELFIDRSAGSEEPDPSGQFTPIRRVQFRLSAGVSGFSVEYLNGDAPPIFFRADWMASKGYRADKLFAVKVVGRSMEPGLYEGDMVVVDTTDTVPSDGVVYAVNYEGELGIKRLRRDAGQWWLSSDNPDKTRFSDKICGDGVFLIGRIVHKSSDHV